MFGKLSKNHATVALTLTAVICLGAATGCDLYDLGGYGGYGDWYGGWGGYGYPASDLYDPTAIIGDVIDYRQEVMDWSNDAWDEYIRQ